MPQPSPATPTPSSPTRPVGGASASSVGGVPERPAADPPSERLGTPPPPTPPAAAAPERLGPYVVEKKLARGGMGEVLLGYDPNLDRRVALKRLSGDLLDDPDALERFKREARATAAVDHPNIAGIHFVGTDDQGRPFLAMEFVEGMNLGEVVREKVRAPYSTVCDWLIQACQGLRAAQKVGIVHRDLKPANLMLARDGTLKIVDFGLAKVFLDDAHKTRTGLVMGTPQYMSPEQGQGRGLDHRSDIYSLGATFYCVLTGRPPYDGASVVDVMMKHVAALLVPVHAVNPEVPLPLCDILHRMMAKDPNERPQDYEDLIADVKAVKLQMLTKERGAFVEGEAAPPGIGERSGRDLEDALRTPGALPLPTEAPPPDPDDDPDASEADADLKAILGKTRRRPTTPHDPEAVLHTFRVSTPSATPGPDDDSPASSWRAIRPAQWAWIAAGLVVVLIAAVALFLHPGGKPHSGTATHTDSGPREDGPGGRLASPSAAPDGRTPPLAAAGAPRSGLSVVLQRMARDERPPPPTPEPPPPDLTAASKTLDRLDEIARALLSHEVAHRRQPSDLAVLVAEQLLDADELLDGWGQPILYRPMNQTLVSLGADGLEGGPDDIVLRIGQTPVLPEVYRALEVESEAQNPGL